MSQKYDLVVIGSGPGGYIAAIRAAQLGLKTACVEKDKTLGGTCLNVGCIPSKAMLESSHHFFQAKNDFAHHGIIADHVRLDLATMLERKKKVVGQLTGGVEFLLKKNQVDRFTGIGEITSPHKISVKEEGQSAVELETENILIATGSVPGSLPGIKIDEKIVVSSTGALEFSSVPKRLVVVGGGYIGLEMGSVWSRLGSNVEVIEYMDRLVPGMDGAVSKELLKILKKQGMSFRLGTAVKSVEVQGDTALLTIETSGKQEQVECDRVLMSVGRQPFTHRLGLENVGIKTSNRGFIEVNDLYQTSVKNIYAIGDVIGGLMLAHKAEEEGVACVEAITGEAPAVNYNLVPGILYTHPEVASSGRTEEQLKEAGIKYRIGMFRLAANGRAISVGETDGFVKLLVHDETDEILGAHIIGSNASEMIHELCLAMEYNATAEDIALTMHGHPTISEAIKEAALNSHGRTLNS